MKLTLVDVAQRNTRCYFCKTTRSVKYTGVLKMNDKRVPICNRCALQVMEELKDE